MQSQLKKSHIKFRYIGIYSFQEAEDKSVRKAGTREVKYLIIQQNFS